MSWASVVMFDWKRAKIVPSSSSSPMMNGTFAYLLSATKTSGEAVRTVPSGRGR